MSEILFAKLNSKAPNEQYKMEIVIGIKNTINIYSSGCLGTQMTFFIKQIVRIQTPQYIYC